MNHEKQKRTNRGTIWSRVIRGNNRSDIPTRIIKNNEREIMKSKIREIRNLDGDLIVAFIDERRAVKKGCGS